VPGSLAHFRFQRCVPNENCPVWQEYVEYDSRDRPFIWSLTGGEQRNATGLADVCIEDDSVSIRAQVIEWLRAGAPKHQRSEQIDHYLERLAAIDTSRQVTADDVRTLYAAHAAKDRA